MHAITHAIKAAWALRSRKSQEKWLKDVTIYFASPLTKWGVVYRAMKLKDTPHEPTTYEKELSVGTVIIVNDKVYTWEHKSWLVIAEAYKSRDGAWVHPKLIDITGGKASHLYDRFGRKLL